jgi:hypothetical protein
MRDNEEHVFMCHANEDKEAVATPLASALRMRNVSVWMDTERLQIGDRLRPAVDAALTGSWCAVVVMSPAFFAKGWPQYELDGIISRWTAGLIRLLPIWHGMTRSEILNSIPSLAYHISRNTNQFTVEQIADEIARLDPHLS